VCLARQAKNFHTPGGIEVCASWASAGAIHFFSSRELCFAFEGAIPFQFDYPVSKMGVSRSKTHTWPKAVRRRRREYYKGAQWVWIAIRILCVKWDL